MSILNNNFIDGHAYVFTCGYKYKVSFDLKEYYYIKTRFKLELTDIKINNVWKPYKTFINELVTLTGLSYNTIDENYRTLIFKTNTGISKAITQWGNYNADIYNTMFDGAWHYVNGTDYYYQLAQILDVLLGSNSIDKTFNDVVITVDPQYIKYPAKEEEYDSVNKAYTTNTHYTGYKAYSNTNVFGFTDLGVCAKHAPKDNNNLVTYALREIAFEYDKTVLSGILSRDVSCHTDYGSVYYRITISNHSLYNNRSIILCTGKREKESSAPTQGMCYESYIISFCYKEILSRWDELNNSNPPGNLTYCTDLQYCADANTVNTNIYTIRQNNHEYYTKHNRLTYDNFNISANVDSIETLRKGQYKINIKCVVTTDYQDISDLVDIILNVNGFNFTIPFLSDTIYKYIIVETAESLYTFNTLAYIKSKTTNQSYRFCNGYTFSKSIAINSALLPRENTGSFGFKINNSNQTITIANTDVNISNCIAAEQLAFRPDYKDNFILSTSNNYVGYYIIVPGDVNAITDDTSIHLIAYYVKDAANFSTYPEALQYLAQTEAGNYDITVDDKTYTVYRGNYIVTGSSYFVRYNSRFECDLKVSELENFINKLSIVNNKITVL